MKEYSYEDPLYHANHLLCLSFRLVEVPLTLNLFETLESLGYREFHAEPNFGLIWGFWEIAFIHESLLLPGRS